MEILPSSVILRALGSVLGSSLRRVLISTTVLALWSNCNIPADASPSRLTSTGSHQTDNLAFVSQSFDLLPPKSKLKRSPKSVEIYDYDGTPLGNRRPLLLVHGLRGEFYANFRWQKVASALSGRSDINQKYKIYLARYSTLTNLEEVIPKFRQSLGTLYRASRNQKITVVALSMGGNLVYESMTDPETDKKVEAVLTLGTPFQGSPLFTEPWLQYSLYKRLSLPITRIDHSLALRLYFKRNKNLQEDLSWTNLDQAIPFAGPFKSRLPLGPRGMLSEQSAVNERLATLVNEHKSIKSKFIAYGAFLMNPYLEPAAVRYIEKTLMYPITLFWVKFPAHLAREHAVLNMLNHDIACVEVTEEVKRRGDTPFHFALNDGITPIASALFLPESAMRELPLSSLRDIPSIAPALDIMKGRVFKNADHLTFIDGYRPIKATSKLKDELHPEEADKDIFSWICDDLSALQNARQHLAEESESAKTIRTNNAKPVKKSISEKLHSVDDTSKPLTSVAPLVPLLEQQ